MDALQAAVLLAKLPHLESWTEKRRMHAANYCRLFTQAGLVLKSGEVQEAPGIVLTRQAGYGRHIYHLFMIRAARRNELIQFLKNARSAARFITPSPPSAGMLQGAGLQAWRPAQKRTCHG